MLQKISQHKTKILQKDIQVKHQATFNTLIFKHSFFMHLYLIPFQQSLFDEPYSNPEIREFGVRPMLGASP